MKTHKASAKRFKKKKKKIQHRRAGLNHNLSKKSPARKRRLKKSVLKKLLPWIA